jgi:hypothetical protein
MRLLLLLPAAGLLAPSVAAQPSTSTDLSGPSGADFNAAVATDGTFTESFHDVRPVVAGSG